MPTPIITIVTVCLNAEHTIRRTIESVLGQTYANINYVLVDGGSSDGTVAVIREYQERLATIISEPDRGISDAFNKGVRAAQGEYIQFLNADDFLPQDFIERAVELLSGHPEAGFAFGDIVTVAPASGKETRIPGNESYFRSMPYVMRRLHHPTVVARKLLFDKYGEFDTRWRVAMDYEWLLRIFRAGVRGVYSPGLTVFMQEGGVSQRQALQAFDEVRDISLLHGGSPLVARPYHALRKVKHGLLQALGRR